MSSSPNIMVGKRPMLGSALDFLARSKPAEAPAEAKPYECAKCAGAESGQGEQSQKVANENGGCAHSPHEVCAECSGKAARPAERAKPLEMKACAHSPFESCAMCSKKSPAERRAKPPAEGGCGTCGGSPRQADAGAADAAGGGGAAGGKGEVVVDSSATPCAAGEIFAREMMKRGGMIPNEKRPLEDGWWTGSWYTSTNTIICDGGGGIAINEATNYGYGVQECTVKHETVHKNDWIARYGADVCKGRKKGDLPHYDPPGKEAYSSFIKASECRAWKVGETCRKEKLAACKDDTCKKEVQGHVDWAATQVKKYCG